MKQYNLKPESRQFAFGALNVITLGERGRGRFETIVPMQSGLTENQAVKTAPTKSGKVKIIAGDNTRDWLARISCRGGYTRGTEGWASVLTQQAHQVEVVASGHGAEGSAGRIGFWADYILYIHDNTLLRVKPHGGYKTPAYYLYFADQAVVRIEEQEIDLFCEQLSIEIPEDIESSFTKIEITHEKYRN